MLILSRKSKEQIQIGDDIKVTILRIKGQSVSIGIDAPNAMRVLRGELLPPSARDGGERLGMDPMGWPVRSDGKATDRFGERSQRSKMFQQDPTNFHDGTGVSVHS